MTGLWATAVKAWCVGVIGFGAGLALGAFPQTDGLAQAYYDLVVWPLDGAGGFGDEVRLTIGVLGAVMMGWGLMMLGLVDLAARVGAPAWRLMTQAMTVWCVVDSAISVGIGVPGNAVANLVFYALFLAPVLLGGGLRAAARETARPEAS